MTILYTFGQEAKQIRDKARAFATCAAIANTYAKDTVSGASTADYDLLSAADDLEAAARDLRQLGAKVEQMRADLNNPVLVAAE